MREENTPLIIDDVAKEVLQGALVIYPTETFFALGCNVFTLSSVRNVFRAKKRDTTHPLPLIVSSIKQAKEISSNIDEISLALMEQFWPGSLTLILPAKESISDLVTAGSGNVALRVSSHPTAQRLVDACGVPLVSSSANISGVAPVVSIDTLDKSLLAYSPIVIQEGSLPAGGLPSTIVQVKNKKLLIKREGVVTRDRLMHAGFCLDTSC